MKFTQHGRGRAWTALAPLAAAALVLTTAVPAAAAPPAQAANAGGWLARQLVDGTHMVTQSQGQKFDDHGLTADTVLALAAAKVADTQADAATDWLAKNLAGYVGPGPGKPSGTGDKTGAAYAGALAKAALVAKVRGRSATAFGGRDLLKELVAREGATGRFSDDSTFGDYSNAISQSLALIVLYRSEKMPTDKSISALESLQCTDGGFRLNFPEAGKTTPCVSDPDATGYAVQSLALAGRTGPAGKGVDYLAGLQQPDGGVPNVVPAGATAVVNANTTGLAAAAFTLLDRPEPAAKAQAFLTGLQQTQGPQAGAIGYAAGTFDPATAARATTGAILGLASVDLSALTSTGSVPTAPAFTAGPTSMASLPATSAPPGTESTVATEPAVSGPAVSGSAVPGLESSPPTSVVTTAAPAAGAANSDGLSTGTVIGMVAAVIVVLGAGWWLLRRRFSQR